jgi:hypothetical protein
MVMKILRTSIESCGTHGGQKVEISCIHQIMVDKLKKLYIHGMSYYLEIQEKELMHATWMNLGNITQSERSQSQKTTYGLISFL